MDGLKRLVGSWNLRDLLFVLAVFAIAVSYPTVLHFGFRKITIADIGGSIAVFALFVLWIRLRKAAKARLPTPRVKYTVSLPIAEVMNEFIQLGYRVEALSDSTIVLVRLKLGHLMLGAYLFSPVVAFAFISWITPENQALAALFFAIISFAVVYIYTIVGYGFDRIAFHKGVAASQSTCVTSVRSFLPSRVRAMIVTTEDHGDEAWYVRHPEYL